MRAILAVSVIALGACAASTATPSAELVPVAPTAGWGMKYFTDPSFALPIRMPRFQSPCAGLTDPDSESATYMLSCASM